MEPDWSQRSLHFVAIGGAGMSGLALIARALGARVTGSDRAESSYLRRLRDAGLEPRLGHDPAAVPEDAEVVVSTAVPPDNPELARARERGQRILHRGELLAEVTERKRLLAVAGTHGKTTTAGMAVWALRGIGADPAFVLGGELPDAGPDGPESNAGWGPGEWIVAEADESDASFLRLRPAVAVVTNVELDHHSHWRSRGDLLTAFRGFVGPARGLALHADPSLDPIVGGQDVIRFGAEYLEPRQRRGRAPDWRPGAELRLRVPGRHNALDALAALAGLQLAGFDPVLAAEALASFPGMRRRLEFKGRHNGASIYDDYAHHPTEVAAALAALRELHPRRLVAVFQPHLYSRTKALAEQFGASLAAADEIGVLDVYPARERPVGELARVSGLQVAEAAAERAGGRPVWWLGDAETAARALRPRLREGEILVTLGAGDIGERLAEPLVRSADGGETR
jgi:UDP-N-acetylmuramate--alanine ligase